MIKTIIGIILFLLQISLALYYNKTVDLVFVGLAAAVIFVYVLYKYFTKQYGQD